MRNSYDIKCEGDADRLIEDIVKLRESNTKGTFTINVASDAWVTMISQWLLEACGDRFDDNPDSQIDLDFVVKSLGNDKLEQKLTAMDEDELSDFLSELLEDLEDQLDEEENDEDDSNE